MKAYRVYVNGYERGIIRAASHNSAEKKAQKLYGKTPGQTGDSMSMALGMTQAPSITVEYTEVLLSHR